VFELIKTVSSHVNDPTGNAAMILAADDIVIFPDGTQYSVVCIVISNKSKCFKVTIYFFPRFALPYFISGHKFNRIFHVYSKGFHPFVIPTDRIWFVMTKPLYL
jgi:hypothetical protein